MQQTIKTLGYYKRLPYTLYAEPKRDSDGSNYWTAEYLELRGCKTDGDTEAEAVANLQELFDEYISAHVENNMEIPEPAPLPPAVEELWIIVQRRRVSGEQLPADTEGTQQTRGETKHETLSPTYEEITT
jgi:predicted RNase H-like HicB family nuclease